MSCISIHIRDTEEAEEESEEEEGKRMRMRKMKRAESRRGRMGGREKDDSRKRAERIEQL